MSGKKTTKQMPKTTKTIKAPIKGAKVSKVLGGKATKG